MKLPRHIEKNEYNGYAIFIMIINILMMIALIFSSPQIFKWAESESVGKKIYLSFILIVLYFLHNCYTSINIKKHQDDKEKFFSSIGLNYILVLIVSSMFIFVSIKNKNYILLIFVISYYAYRLIYQLQIIKKFLKDNKDLYSM